MDEVEIGGAPPKPQQRGWGQVEQPEREIILKRLLDNESIVELSKEVRISTPVLYTLKYQERKKRGIQPDSKFRSSKDKGEESMNKFSLVIKGITVNINFEPGIIVSGANVEEQSINFIIKKSL